MVDFNEMLLQRKLQRDKENAVKRQKRATAAVASGDTKAIANLLRKGEELAYQDELRPYQQAAVLQSVQNYRTGRHTLNATFVGGGKTRVAASLVATVKDFKKVLWLTSKTLIPQTVKEVSSLGGSIVPVGDSSSLYLSLPFPPGTIFITNYEVIKRDPGLWIPNTFDAVIIDECSKLKGGASPRPTQIWKETKDLLHKAHPKAFRYFLSGTPAENRPEEIWAYLHLFDPDKFDSFTQFRDTLCRVNPLTGKLMFSTERLLELLQGSVIRQTVENLHLEGMPSMKDPNWYTETSHFISLDPSSQVGAAYLQLQNDLIAELDDNHALTPSMALEQILRLRQILTAGSQFTYSKQVYDLNGNPIRKVPVTIPLQGPFPKLDAAEELIASWQAEGEQVIIFSCFNQPLQNLHEALQRTGFYTSGLLTGETAPDKRAQLVHDFQQGTLDVILINKKTGSQGLNLQKCDQWPGGSRIIIHLDRWWNPAVEEQANGRALRMNSSSPVISIYLHVVKSIDDYMEAMIQAKLEGVGQMDAGLLKESLERFTLG